MQVEQHPLHVRSCPAGHMLVCMPMPLPAVAHAKGNIPDQVCHCVKVQDILPPDQILR